MVMVLGLMILHDYNNYFYGKSYIDYHKLPYGLTPYYNHSTDREVLFNYG